jgi:hypothetical protein
MRDGGSCCDLDTKDDEDRCILKTGFEELRSIMHYIEGTRLNMSPISQKLSGPQEEMHAAPQFSVLLSMF